MRWDRVSCGRFRAASFLGLLFPAGPVRRFAGPGLDVLVLSRRGLDRVGGQGSGRRSQFDRRFDGQPADVVQVFRFGAAPIEAVA